MQFALEQVKNATQSLTNLLIDSIWNCTRPFIISKSSHQWDDEIKCFLIFNCCLFSLFSGLFTHFKIHRSFHNIPFDNCAFFKECELIKQTINSFSVQQQAQILDFIQKSPVIFLCSSTENLFRIPGVTAAKYPHKRLIAADVGFPLLPYLTLFPDSFTLLLQQAM